MTREEKIRRARELRGQGMTIHQAARELGAAYTTVYAWLNPAYAERNREKSRRWKAANREAKRASDRAYYERIKAPCRECGKPSSGDVCRPCRSEIARRRDDRTVELYATGVPLRGIAEDLGTNVNALGVRLDRLRKEGRIGRRYARHRRKAAA